MAIIKQLNGIGDGSDQVHDFGEEKYTFSMNKNDEFCCEVKDKKHIEQFLSHGDDFVSISGNAPTLEETLKGMKKEDLIAYALTEHGLEVDAKLKVSELKALIAEQVAD